MAMEMLPKKMPSHIGTGPKMMSSSLKLTRDGANNLGKIFKGAWTRMRTPRRERNIVSGQAQGW